MTVPRKRELTWQDGTGQRKGRWKKWYRGKAYYFSFGTSKSDSTGYKQALTAWRKKKTEITRMIGMITTDSSANWALSQ